MLVKMAAIKKFEEIKAWQKARDLNIEIYRISSIDEFAKDFTLLTQIRKASISIMLNIAEGFGRDTTLEYIRFLFIARGSLYELQTQLEIVYNLKYIENEKYKLILQWGK